MSYTSYAEARMSHMFRPTPRKALRPPTRQLALRPDHIASANAALVLKPGRDDSAEVGYCIEQEDGTPVYTVTGRKFGDRTSREFRDESGLPLFEIHRWAVLSVPFYWYLTLPGSDRKARIATVESQTSLKGGDLKVSFENIAYNPDTKDKGEAQKGITLMVRRHGEALRLFDIVDGDRRVGEVRESIRFNEKLFLTKKSRRQGARPAMEIVVVPGVDASLVAAIAVILSDWYFGSG
ncbi:hypothetical protein N7532_009013 [Penicillium argentinense]|uniref:Tubby C-terminal-like domain-containing protein n=1 Tax=Penicillium argentinense TaxID=1131581 RepID=A0A9W9K249_9EURO|nr:uncharacterized protein N7532_009013 [Penicillium argentinense]KAJ5090329.1 hypothetical protein N7532_009013 [Penicillium argentinense]